MNLNPMGAILSKDYYQNKILNSSTQDSKELYQKAYNYNIQRVFNYIKKYLEISKYHDDKFKIPYEITLSQALLESNTGLSELSIKSNNHFGLKPDGNQDKILIKVPSENKSVYFSKYKTVEDSYNGHSIKLQKRKI